VQAALWFADGVTPIPDEAFLAAPREFTSEKPDFRELFLALKAQDCDLQGDLVIEFANDTFIREPEVMNIRSVSLEKGLEIKSDSYDFIDVIFETSIILQDETQLDETLKIEIADVRLKHNLKRDLLERICIKNITLDISRLMRAFGENVRPEGKEDAAPASRGAPPKYNWDAIWAEIVVKADLDGLPKTQADCIRWISDWCQKEYGEAPSETMLKEKLRPVYRHRRKVGK